MQQAGRASAVAEAFAVANGGGVQVIASASINTKGAWAVISAATPWEAHGVCVELTIKSSGADQLIDIGWGTAGNEHVIIPDILYTGGSSSSYNRCMWFPIHIPAGVRLVARTQSQTASVNCRVAVSLFQQAWLGVPSLQHIDAFGVDAAATGGLALSAPAANGWGAWVQMAAAAGANYKWVMPVWGDAGITTRTSGQRFHGQLGMGAAAAEVAIGPEYPWSSSSTSFSQNMFHGFWTDIPASERIVARYNSSAITTLGCDCVVYAGW